MNRWVRGDLPRRLAALTLAPAAIAVAATAALAYVVQEATTLQAEERAAHNEQLAVVALAREIESHRAHLHDLFAASMLGDLDGLRRADVAVSASRRAITAALSDIVDESLIEGYLIARSDTAVDAALALTAGDPPLAQRRLEQLDATLLSFAESRREAAVAAGEKAAEAAARAERMLQQARTGAIAVFTLLSLGSLIAIWVIRASVQLPMSRILRRIEALYDHGPSGARGDDMLNETFRALDRLADSVAERRRALDELTRARDAAEEASRAKSDFLAAMSHELRTPLNAIIGFADAMRAGTPGPLTTPRQREYVEHVLESARDLLSLIENLLDLGRLDTTKTALTTRPLDACQAMRAVGAALAPVADAGGVELRVDVGEAPVLVLGEDRAVRRVLFNLAANAIKFTPAGGAVTLTVEEDAAWGRLSVRDTGRGMSDEAMARAHKGEALNPGDPYRRETPGAGLGLPIARSLALAMDGLIELQPAAPGGLVATLALRRQTFSAAC